MANSSIFGGSILGSKQRENEGFGVFGVPHFWETPSSGNGSKMGPIPGLRSLLKGLFSLLNASIPYYARARRYIVVLDLTPTPGRDPILEHPGSQDDPISGGRNRPKSLILPLFGSRGPDPGLTKSGPKVVQKWVILGSSDPKSGSFRGSRPSK